jgi:mRNA-degrading endonuclease RelE of RelBE toxin-antitoxin system
VEEKRFEVVFSPAARREIERLEIDEALQVAKDIKKYLETSPFPFGKTRIKKLTGFSPPLYRLRSGDFRAYYRIVNKEAIILAVVSKKDSEKILKKLR